LIRRIGSALLLFAALHSAALAQDGDAQADWSFIQRLQADGLPDVAARQLLRFAEQHPADARAPEALLRAGTLYEDLEQTAAALNAYERLLKGYANSEQAPLGLLRKGDLLVDAGRFAEAANVYRGMLSSYPGDARIDQARLGLGESLLSLSRDEEAARNFRYLLGSGAAAPIASRALFDLGILAARAEDDSLAVVYFDSVHERYPEEILGAFGLLRSAETLRESGQFEEAVLRLRAVLDGYEEPVLRARASLGLAAAAEAAGNLSEASRYYREVSGSEAPVEQLHVALLGWARCDLERAESGGAKSAARTFLENYPDAAQADRARLYLLRARLEDEDEGALDELQEFARTAPSDLGHEAWTVAAGALEATGDTAGSLRAWQEAARAAAQPDDAAEALLSEARLAAESLGRHALAAELAMQAHDRAESAELKVQALFLAMEQSSHAGDAAGARESAMRIVRDHPTTSEAAIARLELRRQERRAGFDRERGIAHLSELATDDSRPVAERALMAGRVLRDELGEHQLAVEQFQAAAEHGDNPAFQAGSQFEMGRSFEMRALDLGLDGREDDARDATRRASAAYAQAASIAGGGEANSAALLGLLRMELAVAAAPDTPWEFDSFSAPVWGGVGPAESANRRDPRFDRVRSRLADTVEAQRAGGSAAWGWSAWRLAELDTSLERERRMNLLSRAAESDADLQRPTRFTRALLHVEGDDLESAAAELRRLLDGDSGDALAWAARYELAELHRSSRNFSVAAQLYAEFAGALPMTQKGQRSLLLAGDCALYANQSELAAQRYETLIERHPDSVYVDDSTYRLATAQMRLNRLRAARETLRELIEWPGGTEYRGRALYKLAELERQAKDPKAARLALEELLRTDSEYAAEHSAALELAELLIEEKRPEDALKWIDQHDDKAGRDARSLEARVRARALNGDFGDARSSLERLVEGYPTESTRAVDATLALAEAESESGQHERALERFDAALAMVASPAAQARAQYGRGLTQIHLERMDAAQSAFESSVRLAPESEWAAQSLYKLGQLHLRAQRHEAAQRTFARLASEHPSHSLAPDALRGEANAWRSLGRYDEASKVYHALLENYPQLEGGEKVLAQIAYCHHEMGQHDLAIASYRKVMPYLGDEDQAYAQFWIADSLEQLGRYDESAAEFLRIPYQFAEFGQLAVTAQLKAGGVYEKMGEREAAQRIYERVLSAHGAGSTWGAEAQKRLDRMVAPQTSDSR